MSVSAWAQSARFDQRDDPFEEEAEVLRGGFDPERSEPSGDDPGAAEREQAREEEGSGTVLDPYADQQPVQPVQTAEPLPEPEPVEPYAPLGVRLGSFLLFPEITAESVYADNIFLSSTNPEGDWALALTPSLRAQSDWSRHSLTATVSGEHSFHERFPAEDDEIFSASTEGRLDIRRGTNLVGAASYSEFLEDRSSTDFPENAAERPRGRTNEVSLEGNHAFNRLTLTLRGTISQEDFDDSRLEDGTLLNNDDRDYTERRLTSRAAYEFTPGVSVFFETSVNERIFDQRVNDGGTLSGSEGYDVQGGLAFELSGKLTGEASAGYAIQTPDDPTLEDVDGLIFNAGLEWEATGLTTVRFDARSEVAETTLLGSAGSIVRGAELSVEHRPRRHVVLGASLGYVREEFSGSSGIDEDWTTKLTGEYNLTRSAAIVAGYEHVESLSSDPGEDYRTNEVRLGVRLRR